VITDLLTHEGAIIEQRGEGSLEFLIPSSLSTTLGIPEHGILSFSDHPSSESAINVSYESDIFKAVEKIFLGKGRIAKAVYPSHLPNIDKLSKWVSEKIVLSNATFRLEKIEQQLVPYLLIFFKYVALSDEKREGIFSLLINKRNLSTLLPGDVLRDVWVDLKDSEADEATIGKEMMKAIEVGLSAASLVVKEEFGPFIKSLEKRLNRDIRRVFEYYEALKVETQKAFEKRRLSENHSTEGQDEGVSSQEEASKILSGKLEAIEREKRWKAQDLVSKYALNVRIEPVCALDLEAQAPVFWIDIRRRLSSRAFPLTYNPFFRRMDPFPCEACFYPRGGFYICDEKLHILCANCFKRCPECGRQFCSACSKAGCPRCSKKKV